jgi:hypothetical protein
MEKNQIDNSPCPVPTILLLINEYFSGILSQDIRTFLFRDVMLRHSDISEGIKKLDHKKILVNLQSLGLYNDIKFNSWIFNSCLTKAHASLEDIHPNGWSLLFSAINSNYSENVVAIILNAAGPKAYSLACFKCSSILDQTVLHKAVRHKNKRKVELILATAGSKNIAQQMIEEKDKLGKSSLDMVFDDGEMKILLESYFNN